MNYTNYLAEIKERKKLGLNPKPIDEAELLSEIISQIKDINNLHRKDSLKLFIYNTIMSFNHMNRWIFIIMIIN